MTGTYNDVSQLIFKAIDKGDFANFYQLAFKHKHLLSKNHFSHAIKLGDVSVLSVMISLTSFLNSTLAKGATPLTYAIECGHFHVVSYFIKAGSNINAEDNINESPLLKAIKSGNDQIAIKLIKCGARPFRLSDKPDLCPFLTSKKNKNEKILTQIESSQRIYDSEFYRYTCLIIGNQYSISNFDNLPYIFPVQLISCFDNPFILSFMPTIEQAKCNPEESTFLILYSVAFDHENDTLNISNHDMLKEIKNVLFNHSREHCQLINIFDASKTNFGFRAFHIKDGLIASKSNTISIYFSPHSRSVETYEKILVGLLKIKTN